MNNNSDNSGPDLTEEDEAAIHHEEPAVLASDFFETNSLISKGLDYLVKLLRQKGVAPNSAISQRRIMERFLATNPEVFAIPDGEDFTWAVYRATMPKYQFIGDIALRLEASPCSEAERERMISRKKLVKNPVRMRSKDDLVKARMILSSIH